MVRKSLIVLALLLVAALPAAAQESGVTVVDGLASPRQMSFDSAGSLYIAEAGSAGPNLTASDDPFGASSQITRVAPDGTTEVIVTGLISYRAGNSLGAHDVIVTDDSIWLLLGETSDFRIPFTHALVELDKETYRVKTFVDLLTLELEQDPDGNPNQQSNPVDMALGPDGTVYIANAGCNCLMAWSREAGLSVAAAWSFADDNPVPTAVTVGPDGDIYVGFLTGFPFPQGGARIERWSGGELVQTYTGLTAVTSVLVDAMGTIYAVETSLQGPGRVVMVGADGAITPIAEGLSAPYGLAQAPDGRLLVSVGAFGGQPGAVIALPAVQ